MSVAQKRRFLIWGKTSLELSSKYYETVCTGAVLEDGTPIRLYPIPYRYLDQGDKFKKYQWMTAAIGRYEPDPRPESYRIDCDSIELGECVPTDKDEWGKRQSILFQLPTWQFDSAEALEATQASMGTSLAVVTPREIISVDLHQRPSEDLQSFEEKRASVQKSFETDKAQLRLFSECVPSDMKPLDFQRSRIRVEWRCGAGKKHSMQILDWEFAELQRKVGDAEALNHARTILNLETHAIRFFLGNFRRYPNRFTIVGVWYPQKAKRPTLF